MDELHPDANTSIDNVRTVDLDDVGMANAREQACFPQRAGHIDGAGKPCEKHRVELRDHTGASHPLKADQECRNTMFNGKPQSAAMLVPSLLAKGVRRFRLEALYEDA